MIEDQLIRDFLANEKAVNQMLATPFRKVLLLKAQTWAKTDATQREALRSRLLTEKANIESKLAELETRTRL